MKQAKQQSQDLRQTDTFLTTVTKTSHPARMRGRGGVRRVGHGRVFADEFVHGGRGVRGDVRGGRGGIERLHFGGGHGLASFFSFFFSSFVLRSSFFS